MGGVWLTDKRSGMKVGTSFQCWLCTDLKVISSLWIVIPHLGNADKGTSMTITVKIKRGIMSLQALCGKKFLAQAESIPACGLHHA